jgi:hypothetical protein
MIKIRVKENECTIYLNISMEEQMDLTDDQKRMIDIQLRSSAVRGNDSKDSGILTRDQLIPSRPFLDTMVIETIDRERRNINRR